MKAIETVLAERGSTHGDFTENSAISQQIKNAMRTGLNWSKLSTCQREALDMTAHKIGRLLSGDPNFADHWVDISGYINLVIQRLP